METFKNIWNIVQTFLLLMAGTAAVVFLLISDQPEAIRFALMALGAVCIGVSLLPMSIAYVQANLPKKAKK